MPSEQDLEAFRIGEKLEATIVIRNSETGALVSEIKLDHITQMEQTKKLQQFPVEAAKGKRVFVPTATMIKIEGVSLVSAESLIDYVDNMIKPMLDNMQNSGFDDLDPGEGEFVSFNAKNPMGKVKPEAFGIDQETFEKRMAEGSYELNRVPASE